MDQSHENRKLTSRHHSIRSDTSLASRQLSIKSDSSHQELESFEDEIEKVRSKKFIKSKFISESREISDDDLSEDENGEFFQTS